MRPNWEDGVEEKNLDTTTKEEPARRPWVAPAFESVPLGDALGGIGGSGTDAVIYS